MRRAGKRSVPGRIHVRLSRLSFIPGRNRFAHLVAAALLICDGAKRRRHCLAIPAAIPEAGSAKCAYRFWRRTFRNRDAPDRAPAFSIAGSEFVLQREVHQDADRKDPGTRTPGKLRTRRRLFPAKAAVRLVRESHRFLGVLHPTSAFCTWAEDRDGLPTNPQSLHRSAHPRGAQPIWSTSLGAQR